MAQTVLITLTTAGTNTGPFDLYSDADGYITAFETGISKLSLTSGYLSSLVPDVATIIRVQSTGDCTNYIDLGIVFTTTTTTSTSTSTSTTSTSTSTSTSTTSTTTTQQILYRLQECNTLISYSVAKTFVFSLSDVVQFQIGTPGSGTVLCGTIIDTNFAGTPDATLFSGVSYECGDVIHCDFTP